MKWFRKSNIGVLIYLLLNFALWEVLLSPIFQASGVGNMSYVYVALTYMAACAVSVSPIGTWLMRVCNGARRIKRRDWSERFHPILHETLRQARSLDKSIPDEVRLFYINDPLPNAYALDRNCICITTGLMRYPDEQIAAVMAHEIGHIANGDTFIPNVVVVSNLLISGILVAVQIIRWLITLICFLFTRSFAGRLAMLLVQLFTWLPLLLAQGLMSLAFLLVNASNRGREYDADAFAAKLGYKNELVDALEALDTEQDMPVRNLWQTLNRSHPDVADRVARLQSDQGNAAGGNIAADTALGRVLQGNVSGAICGAVGSCMPTVNRLPSESKGIVIRKVPRKPN